MGKTTLAFQVSLYCDPTFCLERVCFSPEQFLEALQNAKKGQAIVYDESYTIGSRFAMSDFNKKVVSIMSQVRSKNLFISFVLPSIFDLDRTLSLYRVDCLFHVYKSIHGRKGFYSVFFDHKVKDLYINGKKYYSYYKPKANYLAKFSDCFVLHANDYEKKKQIELEKIRIGMGSRRKEKWKDQRDKLIKMLKKEHGVTYANISRELGDLTLDECSKIGRGER